MNFISYPPPLYCNLPKFSSTLSGMPKALEGIRVIECGHLVAGPFAGTLLAYFGAEVIKVEPPNGDQIRDYRTLHDETQDSLWWYSIGRNKHTISLDLKHDSGRKVMRDLIEKSDVLIENFKPGKMEQWNMGPNDVKKDLIYARISGYGQYGPHAKKPGFASVCEAVGGLRYVNGFPGGESVRPNLSLGDTLGGLHAALGILVALLAQRNSQVKGQVVDVAIYESVFNMLEAVLPEYHHKNTVRQPSGSTLTGIVPSNTYQCKDDKVVVIGANTDTLFKKLMLVIGKPDMAKSEKYDSNAKRVEHVSVIDSCIVNWTKQFTSNEVIDQLDTETIPVGRINSIQDIYNDPHFKARSMFETILIAGKELKIPALCPKLDGTPGSTNWGGRQLGENTAQILHSVLKLTNDEIQDLVDSKAIFVKPNQSDSP